MTRRVLREAVVVLLATGLLLVFAAIWGVPGKSSPAVSVEAAVSFEESLGVD